MRDLIAAPDGKLIPLGQVSTLTLRDDPPVIKSENGLLFTNVPVDLESGLDIATYVKRAQDAIDIAVQEGGIRMSPGYYMEWSGQFEFMEEVNKRLKVIVPITIVVIFLLLYFNFNTSPKPLL